eukprot:1153084-Pelagomonas_calceolata.AAC.3
MALVYSLMASACLPAHSRPHTSRFQCLDAQACFMFAQGSCQVHTSGAAVLIMTVSLDSCEYICLEGAVCTQQVYHHSAEQLLPEHTWKVSAFLNTQWRYS